MKPMAIEQVTSALADAETEVAGDAPASLPPHLPSLLHIRPGTLNIRAGSMSLHGGDGKLCNCLRLSHAA